MQAPKVSSKPRELVPAGNHVARLYGITYIGEVNTGYQDNDGNDKWQHKVRLNWELPNELRMFGKEGEEKELPMSISREVTFSLYKSEKQTAILRTITHALIGTSLTDAEAETFDIDNLIGKPCMVEVSHETIESNGNKFAKAIGFGSIPKGLEVPAQVNDNRIFNVATATQEEIEAQPEFIREKMKSSRSYHVRFLAPRSENPQGTKPETEETLDADSIPF